MVTVTCEIQWLVYLLQDFKVPSEQPFLLYCDNDLARYIAANPVFHKHTKHIEIDCHIVREKLKKKNVSSICFSFPPQSRHLYQSLKSYTSICLLRIFVPS